MAQISDLIAQSPFRLHVRQALIAAQHGILQVGLLLISVDLQPTIVVAGETVQGQLLYQAWVRIRSTLRNSDAIFRTQEGHMAVLLPSIASAEDAVLVAKKLLRAFEQPLFWNDSKISVPIRIGIALFPGQSRNATELIRHAGEALSAAVGTGEAFAIYSQPAGSKPRGLLPMSELRQAIVEDQLFLLYQPKVKLRDGTISGVEVLARWEHPQLGLIEPDEFIPIAERTGLIIPLTLWVLHQSLIQCRAWNRIGIDLPVAVNLSMLNLSAPELPEQIAGLLKDAAVPPDKLELEITESAIMEDPQRTLCTLKEIRSLGVRLAIDDFGTGYSALAHLSRLPVTTIKIDKSFIRDIETVRDSAVIVKSIIDLAHNLELNVVAEGVETLTAKEMLVAFECDEAQGYYFSRPVRPLDIHRTFGESAVRAAPQEMVAKEL
ncbi:MAG: putative bifunctional diguanylate cyclase/phosphodiesterase [Candidatus Binatia bacterium]